MRWHDLFTRTVVIVSGKGGTGKSTVAAALSRLAASNGRRTLLVEVEGRAEMARTISMPDPGFDEARTPFGFSALSITPREAAIEYVHMFVGMDRATRPLLRSGVLDQVISGAPGFRDLLSCGKLYEIGQLRRPGGRTHGRPQYDLIVVDGPPTGQIVPFLLSASAFADLARVGRIKRQAAAIEAFLRRHAKVLLVAVPEEMAVAETLETIPTIRRTGVPVATVAVNRCLPEVLPSGTRRAVRGLAPEDLVPLCAEAGVQLTLDEAAFLLSSATKRDRRWKTQQEYLQELDAAAHTLRLPDIRGMPPPETVASLARIMAGETQVAVPSGRDLNGKAGKPAERGVGWGPATRGGARRPTRELEEKLAKRRIVVVCGSGGVGKTTISAAVAVHLGERRDKAALLTVDPARRLATALGLPMVAGERTSVDLGRARSIEAVQLDTQRTFDELIERHAGSAERRDRILSNRFYQRISNTLAGTHEYMAMEKLFTLADEEDHDAIVVDTPPTRSALSFLDAPNRLTDFLGGRMLRWMLWPSAKAGRLTVGVARFGAQAFARTAGRLIGTEILADTAEFLAAFQGMYAGFQNRAERVLDLLRSPECGFLIVSAPTGASLEEAGYFLERLRGAGMRAEAVVVNRWHPEADRLPSGIEGAVDRLASGDASARAAAAVLIDRLRREPQRRSEEEAVEAFSRRHRRVPLLPVAELAEDVHDVRGLRLVGANLFEEIRE